MAAFSDFEQDCYCISDDGSPGTQQRITATENAALAKHGHGRALPGRDQVYEAMRTGIPSAHPEVQDKATESVMGLLERGRA